MSARGPRYLAKQNGEKFYKTTAPCKRGHIDLRITSTGSCITCKRELENLRVSNDREKYNKRKQEERFHKLPELAKKAKLIRKNESEEKRVIRLEKAKIKQRIYWALNKDKPEHKEKRQKYLSSDIGKLKKRVGNKRYHLKQLQRTPKWLTEIDYQRIENEYRLAALQTKLTGEPWHVDHIIPLQGKYVSGLHVPSNLRAMRGSENIKKSNKYLPT